MEDILVDLNTINELRDIGDDEFLKELMDTFTEQSNEILDGIDEAYSNKNNILVSQLSHKLKGSALNLGTNKLALICKYLELNTREAFPEDTYNKIHELKNTYKDTVDELKKIIK